MFQLAKVAQLVRSSGRLFHALVHSPSVRHCVESTTRLLMTNVIVLRETEKALLRRFLTRYAQKYRHMQRVLMGACLFSWAEDRISDEEINHSLSLIFDLPSTPALQAGNELGNEAENERSSASNQLVLQEVSEVAAMPPAEERWEQIVNSPEIHLWRRPMDIGVDDRELFEYRGEDQSRGRAAEAILFFRFLHLFSVFDKTVEGRLLLVNTATVCRFLFFPSLMRYSDVKHLDGGFWRSLIPSLSLTV